MFQRIINKENYEKYKWIIYFFLFLPVFKYESLKSIDFLAAFYHVIYRICPLVLGIFSLLWLFVYKKKKPSPLLMVLFILCFWMIIDMYRNYGADILSYRNVFYLIFVGCAIEGLINCDYTDLLKGLMLNCEIAIYFDIFTKTINLLNNEPKIDTFTGYYNNTTVFALPSICIAALFIKNTGKNKRGIVLILSSIFMCFLSTAGTPKGAVLAFIGLVCIQCFLFYKLKLRARLWPWIVLATVFGIFIVFVYRPGILPILDSFITNVLHRSLDFTERTDIWDEAINVIRNSPIIGQGCRMILAGKPHAHNMYLEITVEFGLIGLVLFSVFNVVYIKEIDKQKDDISKIIFIGLLFAMHLTFIVDFYTRNHLYYLMIFLMYHGNNNIIAAKNNF